MAYPNTVAQIFFGAMSITENGEGGGVETNVQRH